MMTVLEHAKTCNYCHFASFQMMIHGKYGDVVRCKNCGLMFRTTKSMDFPMEHIGSEERMDRQFQQKQKNQLGDYASCFPVIDRYSTPGDHRFMLEVGSHTGEFLDLARSRGWTVKGVEPDRRVAEIASTRYGLDIIPAFLRDANIPSDCADVIVMFHVIEHFFEPLEELVEMHRILKPGGMLVIETPRFDTIWFNLLKEHERSVIPDHYFYFTAKTITAMLQKAGFSVVQINSTGRTLALDRLFTNISKVVDSAAFSRAVIRTTDSLHMDRIRFYINMGDLMRVYAVRPKDV